MSESARIKILTTVIMKRKRDGKRFASFTGITNESVIVNITDTSDIHKQIEAGRCYVFHNVSVNITQNARFVNVTKDSEVY